MAADRFDTLQRLFNRARTLPGPERVRFLGEACGGDEALRREVEALLAEAEDPIDLDGLVDRVVDAALEERVEEVDGQIGPYRVLDRIGEGGSALVYRAEQREPIRRTVALKILKPGMDSRAVLARFDSERQTLAVMDHPNIARVIDAGMTARGRPFFVMDLVRGVPINAFVDRERLTVRERLTLFLSVCDAVQHAHQKGIIHRDLKPANILVEMLVGRATPKVIDFGIAKALGAKLTDLTVATAHGQLIGTPGYMSPEQAGVSGLDVDTRADVYSLGVVLYELLVGALPIDTSHATSFEGLRRSLHEEEPARPSTRLPSGNRPTPIAACRRTDLPALRRDVRGELDWITMRAIERERSRRYAGVSELAADVRRYLANEVVLAGPPRVTYRVAKFVRRHRVPVASAALVLVAVLVAGAVSVRYGMQARRSQRRAEAVSAFLQDFIMRASPFAEDAGPGVTLTTRLDAATDEVTGTLGAYPEAEAEVRLALARAYDGLAEHGKAETQASRARAIADTTLGPAHRLTLDAMSQQGLSLFELNRDAEAQETLRRCIDAARRTLGPDDAVTLAATNNLAIVLKVGGYLAEAETLLADTVARRRRVLGSTNPETLISVAELARLLHRAGRYGEAAPLLREVLAGHEDHFGPDHPQVWITADQLGQTLRELGRLEEAAALHRRAYEGFSRTLGPSHADTLGARMMLAQVLARQGDHATAEAELAATHTLCVREFGPTHRYTLIVIQAQTRSMRMRGAAAEAAALLRPAFEAAAAELGWEARRVWLVGRAYALALQDQDRHADALALLQRIRTHAGARLAADELELITLDAAIARSRLALESSDEAAATLERELTRLLDTNRREDDLTQRGLSDLAAYHASRGQDEAAARFRRLMTPRPRPAADDG